MRWTIRLFLPFPLSICMLICVAFQVPQNKSVGTSWNNYKGSFSVYARTLILSIVASCPKEHLWKLFFYVSMLNFERLQIRNCFCSGHNLYVEYCSREDLWIFFLNNFRFALIYLYANNWSGSRFDQFRLSTVDDESTKTTQYLYKLPFTFSNLWVYQHTYQLMQTVHLNYSVF